MAFEPKQVLAYERVDDDLALSLALGVKGPFCTIENLATNKKKSVRLSWLESGKGLQIKVGKGALRSYDPETLFRASRSLTAQTMAVPQVRVRLRQVLNLLLGAVHEPRTVIRERDFRVLSEDRRRGLWLACFPDAESPGVLRPCFSYGEAEQAVLAVQGTDHGDPWGFGFDLAPGERGLGPLKRYGVVASLVKARSERWFRPVALTAAAMVMGLSDGSSDEEGTVVSLLWRPLMAGNAPDPDSDHQMLAAAGRLLENLRLFIRHYDHLGSVMSQDCLDADDMLKAEGFGRRERFEDNSGAVGKLLYTISRHVRDDGKGALVCHVKGPTFPPKEDMVLFYGAGIYEEILRDDACGSLEDGRFSMLNLFRVCQMRRWLTTAEWALGGSETIL